MAGRVYTEADCLHIIDCGAEDASDLLHEAMPTARRRFMAADKALRDLLADVQKSFPDACYYTGAGGLKLLLGSPHSARLDAQQQLVALTGRASIGDGDW
jgi:hypothetical protein